MFRFIFLFSTIFNRYFNKKSCSPSKLLTYPVERSFHTLSSHSQRKRCDANRDHPIANCVLTGSSSNNYADHKYYVYLHILISPQWMLKISALVTFPPKMNFVMEQKPTFHSVSLDPFLLLILAKSSLFLKHPVNFNLHLKILLHFFNEFLHKQSQQPQSPPYFLPSPYTPN